MQFKKTLTVLAATIALFQPALAQAEHCVDSNQILEATTDQTTCLTIEDLKEIGTTTLKRSRKRSSGNFADLAERSSKASGRGR